MEKPFLKRASVYVTGILALGICVAGFYVSNQRQYQQRVAYANAAQPREENELNDLAQQVEELYLEDEQDLLKEETTLSDVTDLKNEVHRIDVSAEDFQIEENALPQGIQELAQQKESVSDRLTDAEDKLHMQDQIDGLFTEETPDWQEYKDDVITDEDLQEEDMADVNDNLGFFEDDQWLELAQSYTQEANEQFQSTEDIQEKLTQYEDEEITYEQYAALAAQIEEVRNPEQQERFEETAEELGDRFGVSTQAAAAEAPTTSAAVEDETIVDGQGEEQGAQVEQENTEAY
ncbi:hypothetical protein C7K38_02800 [Tetragenococcus osmophilus]|uniref:Uncharacterized protein n=1 Tax=Tetragenococcus osmophilus TaxID=526944 RepID=A0AA37XMZ7_9ENTE|nr:hypothetical protein [Tetragenococcus osmophilus]AYW47391.1 hypothetical protein C7K38_02800 [Tetragenococcus osmophilus]GMA52961.1 hypothetical protein GCM10025857_43180 [Alicyclobacillus contaminans]GMA73051.1 hypothetical protein GCM10025885_21000 [Tetragenococcus osmophilus]